MLCVYIGVSKAVLDLALHDLALHVLPISPPHIYTYIGVANAIFDHLSMKLPISRLQRDLTDSTGTTICVSSCYWYYYMCVLMLLVLLYVCPLANSIALI